jgi:hypothetical protein
LVVEDIGIFGKEIDFNTFFRIWMDDVLCLVGEVGMYNVLYGRRENEWFVDDFR